ncbi:MAG TPA: carboxypeptidase-like regulatory domain-containing protein [Actinomycetota bacterium]|nr:carboxypeptidase-like regulatory domain-containing protein [Actinomycetota bacterium]
MYALPAAALAATVVLAGAGPVAAGDWVTVGKGLVDSSRPDVARGGRTTRVVWTTPAGSLNSRVVSARGTLRAVEVVTQGWDFLSPDPVRSGGRYVAAGLRAAPGSWAYWPGYAFSTSGELPMAVTDWPYAYASQGQDATTVGGRLVYVFTDGGAAVRVTSPGAATAEVSRGTAFMPAIAGDGPATHIGWFSAGPEPGILVAPVGGLPAAATIGQPVAAPGSGFTQPAQRVALASLSGNAWTAYPVATDRIRIWQVGDPGWRDLRVARAVVAVDLAAAADGRLWLAYLTGRQACTARSDPRVRRFGAPTCRRLAGGVSVTLTAASSAEVVATDGRVARYARFLPGLSVRVDRRRGRVRVLDAGVPVSGARVTVANRTARTNARGLARLTWVGQQRVDVRAPGYERAAVRG